MRQLGLLPVALAVAAATLLALAHTGEIRGRALEALGHGMPAREAELARGFVLGEDEGIDAETVEDFRRAGLSHLLAVSGQNVALLALLAMPLLALLGLPLGARLVWVTGLIALYVPLAGAGPSIQRAAVMGALSVLATLGGRRASRLHALAVAAVVTLAVDPGIGADVGWQLSFAAVLGILLLAAPLSAAARARLALRGHLGRALADGAAMTTAATLSTAPLIAFHFGELSTVTLLANLLALPAVAPAMWLGMLAAAAGQVPGLPVEAVNRVNALLLAYVAQVAAWCAAPAWASLEVRIGARGLLGSYAALAAAALLVPRIARARRIQRLRHARIARPAGRFGYAGAAVALSGVALLLALAGARGGGGVDAEGPRRGLRITFFDIGQGDAILLQPGTAPPVLVDAGPPGAGLVTELREAGVDGLAAAVVTHDQSDHAGGVEELLGAMPVGRLLYAVAGRGLTAGARAAGVSSARIASGSELRSGRLRMHVVWPPPALLPPHAGPGAALEDPNRLSVVMVARWGGFSMLLCADAEAEAVPLDPGPVDVLKVSHHGSEDTGLDELLRRSVPRLAVISVGEDNPYGHPTATTVRSLAAHGVRTFRTDRDGTVVIEVRRGELEADAEG